MKGIAKIDKELLAVAAMTTNLKVECIAYVDNFILAKNYFKDKNNIIAEFPFIKALALSLDRNEMIDLCSKSWINFISKQTSVMALMNVARKVLKLDDNLTGKNISICYIDTGISAHGDFILSKNRIIKFIDLFSSRTQPYDDNGHGTFVAGVGSGDGKLSNGKYKGIAPNSNIISVKALNGAGEASAIKILDAMQWVYDNYKKYNIKVVCMSFGSEPLGFNDPIMKGAEALWDRGIVVVAAAGNSGPEFQTIKSPGISPKIITVGGINDNRLADDTFQRDKFEIATFSSRGPALRRYKPDLVAPAVNITSCSVDPQNPYTKLSGTSVATPMVAGLCALLFELNNKMPPDVIKSKLMSICESITFNRNLEGNGLPDMSKLKKFTFLT